MMDFPRCSSCKHWSRYERTEPGVWYVGGNKDFAIDLPIYRGEDGVCARLPQATHFLDVDHKDCHTAATYQFSTDETFGCVLHEAKE